MRTIILKVQAGQVSAELARCGVPAETPVHVAVNLSLDEGEGLPMAAIATAGGALDWLADEPELYTDADLVQQAS